MLWLASMVTTGAATAQAPAAVTAPSKPPAAPERTPERTPEPAAKQAPAPSQPARPLLLQLQPGPFHHADRLADIDRGTGVVDVTLTIPDLQVAADTPLLQLPLVVANVETVAITLKELTVRDSHGTVPLATRDVRGEGEGEGGEGGKLRVWTSPREVQGDLVVHYQAPVDNAPPRRGAAPPYSLRTEGGGFSGVGNVFVLLPSGSKPYPLALHWDLSRLGEGASATSSFGDGDVTLPPGAPARLWSTVFMAGPMQRVPADGKPQGFSSAWLGKPGFDPEPLMTWAGKLHDWMADFFGDASQAPYRVFLRYNPINAGGGAALAQSFLVTYGKAEGKNEGKGIDAEELKLTLSHEMTHTWTEGPDQAWYEEGVAVFYQARAPYRAGLLSADQFLADLNQTAARYYADALNTTPDAEIMPRFWEDTRIRTLPYDRGALYLAIVDARVRKASGGKRSLDDLVREMRGQRHAKPQQQLALWQQLLARELGPAGTALHAAMLAGDLMVPESGDFGPCFQRGEKMVRRFELGFEPASLVGQEKTIRGLQEDSAAAKAGLRNGDVVTYRVALDKIQGDQKAQLTLDVTRDGRQFPVTYLPRGERVKVWQWQRVPGTADDACGI
ncbi:hypothetical protein ASF61_12375 [Duganella sp. Leaf126]|nr:hypothetical protein ASF61_12375 [Duganella sp. Leaf126]